MVSLNQVLEEMKLALQALGKALLLRYGTKPTPMPAAPTAPIPENEEVPIVRTPTTPSIDTLEPWTDPLSNRHNVRVLCDLAVLTLQAKNIITACVEVESGFYNYLPNGSPITHKNYDQKGTLLSTDWGIVQINDYYHIGAGKDFPSAEYVMANPQKAVQFMIDMYKAGRLSLWVSYSSGEYLKYMPA